MGDKANNARVVAVCVSAKKGMRKKNIGEAMAIVNHGIEHDAHAADWHRQISLLALESIEKMRQMGLDVGPGDFAENLTTEGIELTSLPIGTRLRAGEAELEVTQIGKECHTRCAIYRMAGDCVMPREGIFTRVVSSGRIRVGDTIEVHGPGAPEGTGA